MAQVLQQASCRYEESPTLRYPIIFIILAVLIAMMPTEKPKDGIKRSDMLIVQLFSTEQQESGKAWLDEATAELRAMKPMHQLLAMATAIILIINAGIIVAYLVNSIAAITGIGFSLAVLFLFILLAIIGLLLGWKAPRTGLKNYMKDHAEFGPFMSRLSNRMWKRRFRRAAKEHGFARQY